VSVRPAWCRARGGGSGWVYDSRDRHRIAALSTPSPIAPIRSSRRPSPRRVSVRLAAAVAALALVLQPAAGRAQVDNLPRLGDAGGEELSPVAERRLGEAIMRDLRRDPAVADDVEVGEYLAALGGLLSQTPAAAGFGFEFFLVRDASLNAFALPGGFIGVHSGLIVASQTESELASVLAHEIGHVTQRHIARMLARQRQTSMVTLAATILGALAARSNPQAMVGVAAMAGGAQQQQMLAFSRDAEREADRVGLETLRAAGFEPAGMVAFFGRLQQASRLSESSAPGYMRSHPLTAERIADMQLRVQDERYRQRPDSLEFRLVRARLRALSSTSVDGLRDTRALIERQLRERSLNDELAAWFTIATAALAQRDFAATGRALSELRLRLPDSHPMVERLAAEARLTAGDPAGALALARSAALRFPQARALIHLQGEALLATGDAPGAAQFLEEQIAAARTDIRLWRQLARARALLGQTALAHVATGEEYGLAGQWRAAVEQLRIARRLGTLDFYTGSQVDARMREFETAFAQEQREQPR
jgi:predicted Zn-dependent protease